MSASSPAVTPPPAESGGSRLPLHEYFRGLEIPTDTEVTFIDSGSHIELQFKVGQYQFNISRNSKTVRNEVIISLVDAPMIILVDHMCYGVDDINALVTAFRLVSTYNNDGDDDDDDAGGKASAHG